MKLKHVALLYRLKWLLKAALEKLMSLLHIAASKHFCVAILSILLQKHQDFISFILPI